MGAVAAQILPPAPRPLRRGDAVRALAAPARGFGPAATEGGNTMTAGDCVIDCYPPMENAAGKLVIVALSTGQNPAGNGQGQLTIHEREIPGIIRAASAAPLKRSDIAARQTRRDS